MMMKAAEAAVLVMGAPPSKDSTVQKSDTDPDLHSLGRSVPNVVVKCAR
jgi:hypothetical protein